MKNLFLRAEFGPLWEPWEEDEIGIKVNLVLTEQSTKKKKTFPCLRQLFLCRQLIMQTIPDYLLIADYLVQTGR